ncbi:MAG: GAF domain-containing protein [Nocardioides sp.]
MKSTTSVQRAVAASRVRFLTDETPEPSTVRGTILASWRRSHELHVAADKIQMNYDADAPLDTRLSINAEPVLRSLGEQLQGQAVSIVLTDHTGLVLRRLTGDGELERHLDRVQLAPGFSYAEEFVGTNGIGTALEVGGPAHVFGHEHYAENLEELACAGVPIHHPVSGRLVGAVDLTCWRRDAGPLLLTLAKSAAGQITNAMLADASSSQLVLFQEYLRTCSRRTGIVFALDKDVVMLNDRARAELDPADQATLLSQAVKSMSPGRRGGIVLELPSGQTARMYCRPVEKGDRSSGIVAHVRLEPAPAPGSHHQRTSPRSPLPGLVGSGPPWLHACEEVERIFLSGRWLALEGEAGVGKLAVLRAVQLRRRPVGKFVVADARDAREDRGWLASTRRVILDESDSLVIRHVDALDVATARVVSATLREAADREHPLWVAVTLEGPQHDPRLDSLLQLFPRTVELPPLRLHLEDLPLLVAVFLARLSHGGHLTCSPEAMRLLTRMSWPGNTQQLHDLLTEVVKRRRSGLIEADDLPPEAHSVSRRRLSQLEAMERDAIVRGLADAHGNKARAALSLGVSRATIYRKIHEYGIVTPES